VSCISLWMQNNCRRVLMKFIFDRVLSDVEDFQVSVASAEEEERERLRDEDGISSAAGRHCPDWPAGRAFVGTGNSERDLSLLRSNPGAQDRKNGRAVTCMQCAGLRGCSIPHRPLAQETCLIACKKKGTCIQISARLQAQRVITSTGAGAEKASRWTRQTVHQ
jgi:hypothetical protein